MRKNILALQAILLTMMLLNNAWAQGKITIDPNTPGSTPKPKTDVPEKDPRLDQKVTYRVKLRPISDLANDLTKLTGITFYSGSNKSDWRVREDCATVIAKEVPLASLMNSIAHVMKFKCNRGGKAPNWTYRLVEDQNEIRQALERERKRKEADAEKRLESWKLLQNICTMSDIELAKLKEDQPRLYLLAKNGVLQPVVQLLRECPAAREAWLAGEDFQLSGKWMDSKAQQAALNIMRAGCLFNQRLAAQMPDYYKHEAYTLDKVNKINGLDPAAITIDISKGRESFMIQVTARNVYFSSFDLSPTTYNSERLLEKALVQSLEQKRPFDQVFDELESKTNTASNAGHKNPESRILSNSQEPFLEHSGDENLKKPLKDKIEATTITGLIESLAAATGYAIITDDYRGKIDLKFDKETLLERVMKHISKLHPYYSWQLTGQLLDLWDVNWYNNRQARVSKAWLEELRRKLRTTGTLDIDDLAQIASLTNDQINKNIRNDRVLRYAMPDMKERPFLKLYASLTPAQRAMLFSSWGIAFADLTAEQQQAILKFVMGVPSKDVSFLENTDLAAIEARVACSRSIPFEGISYIVYGLTAYTNSGQLPIAYKYRTPLYIEPKKSETKKK